MANSKLDKYLDSVRERLHTSSEAETQQQIQELRQHLESLAAHTGEPLEEHEASTEQALTQFGSPEHVAAALNRAAWRSWLKGMPEFLVTILSVVTVLSMVGLIARFSQGSFLQGILIPAMPSNNGSVTLFTNSLIMPSLLLGGIAAALLIFRDGAAGTARRLLNRQTVSGAAFSWLVLRYLSSTILMVGLSRALIAQNLWDMETFRLLAPVFSIVPAGFAGWVTARNSPRTADSGIRTSIAITIVMGLIDYAMQTMVTNSSLGNHLVSNAPLGNYLQTITLYTACSTLSALTFARLASALNRRQRYERVA